VEQVGAPLRLYHNPRNLFVAGFIGSPQMNFVKTTVAGTAPDGVTVTLPGGSTVTARVSGEGLERGAPVTLGIRPEHLVMDGPGMRVVGTADVVEELGESHFVHILLPDGQRLVARAPGDAAIAEGDKVAVGIDGALCHLFFEDGLACDRLI
jgi:ABC-type sugar transport system ATPase subunit